MKKQLKSFVLLIGLVTSLVSCENKEEQYEMCRVTKLEKCDISSYINCDGVVESTETLASIITNITSYKVKSLNFKVGDMVKAGDIICTFDMSEVERAIENINYKISNADSFSKTKLSYYNDSLENARKNKDVALSIADNNLNKARKILDEAKNKYNSDNEKYNNALSRKDDIQKRIDSLEVEVEAEKEKLKIELMEVSEEISQYLASSDLASSDNEKYNNALSRKDDIQKKIDSLEAEVDAEKEKLKIELMEVSEEIPQYLACIEEDLRYITEYEYAVKSAENDYNTVVLEEDRKIKYAQLELDTYLMKQNISDEENTADLKNQLKDLQNIMDKSVVTAEKNGIVTEVYAQIGKVCDDGLIMKTVNDTSKCVHISISEKDYLSVKPGMNAVITTNASKDKYDGVVDKIMDFKSNDVFDGYILVKSDDNFRIGMKAKAKIIMDDKKDVIAVNRSMIFVNDEEKDCVYKAEYQSDNSYVLREVVINEGITNNTSVEIISDEIKEGDYIICEPQKYTEGQIVNISYKNETGANDE